MPPRCFLGCSGAVHLHVFPNPNKFPEQFKRWVEAVGGQLNTPENYSFFRMKRLCDRHFTDKDRNRNNRLNALAIPSLFFKGHPQTIKKEHGSSRKRHIDHNYCMDKSKASTSVSPLVSTTDPVEYASEAAIDDDLPFDDDLPVVTEKESQKLSPQEHIFSWQKDDAVVPCDDVLDLKIDYMEVDAEDEPENEKPVIKEDEDSPVHQDICCNACQTEIVGFRYVCVQCVDYDLCSCCEARGLHHSHYVLRVPGPRPQSEVQEMLQTIRRVLSESIIQLDVAADGAVEIKSEEEDPLVEEDPMLREEDPMLGEDDPPPSPSLPPSDDDSNFQLSEDDESDWCTTEPLSPPQYFDSKNNPNYDSIRSKQQIEIIDPNSNHLSKDDTDIKRTEDERLAMKNVQEDELDTVINIEVINSEPIDPKSNETVPPLDDEFLTSVVLNIPEVANAKTCDYVLQIALMNCNYYIQVKKMTHLDRDKQLVKKYCGDKIACVPLTRLMNKEILAATDQQRTDSKLDRKQKPNIRRQCERKKS